MALRLSHLFGLIEVIADLVIPISLGVLVALFANPDIASGDRVSALWDQAPALIFLISMVLIVGPAAFILKICVRDLALMPGFSHLLRWQAHNQIMKQDVTFFANDFAGRLSTRVMQLGFALRDVVLEASGTLLYSILYLIGAVAVLAWYSLWLTLPMVIYILVFALLVMRFMPEIERRSRKHSEMRSELTGRIVDSYTNIQTLKLFADPAADRAYVAEALDQANYGWVRVMRTNTWMFVYLALANALLIVVTSLIAIWLWAIGADNGAALATALPLTLTIMLNAGHLAWVMSGIVEQIGTVAESAESIAHKPTLVDSQMLPIAGF